MLTAGSSVELLYALQLCSRPPPGLCSLGGAWPKRGPAMAPAQNWSEGRGSTSLWKLAHKLKTPTPTLSLISVGIIPNRACTCTSRNNTGRVRLRGRSLRHGPPERRTCMENHSICFLRSKGPATAARSTRTRPARHNFYRVFLRVGRRSYRVLRISRLG